MSTRPVREAGPFHGWVMHDSAFVALNGQKVWVVSGRKQSHSFSVQGATQDQAWDAAQQLARRLMGADQSPSA